MAFSVLECEKVCGGDWLHRDQQEPCWIGRHLDVVLFISFPALIFFILLLPGMAVLFLWRRRKKLYRSARMTFRFGMLYSGYRSEYWYWELVTLLRKFTIILIVTFGRNFGRQLHIALGALVIFYHYQLNNAPYPKTEDGAVLHRVELESIAVLLTMTWVSVFFSVSTCEANDFSCSFVSLILGIFIILINIIFFIKAVWYTAKKFNEKEAITKKMRKGARRLREGLSDFSRKNSAVGRKSSTRSSRKKKSSNRPSPISKSKKERWSLNPVKEEEKEEGEHQVHVRNKTEYFDNKLFHNQVAQKHFDPNLQKYYWHDPKTAETWWAEEEEEEEENEEALREKAHRSRMSTFESIKSINM